MAGSFGPIMIIWFLSLSVLGIFSIANTPVLLALDPSWGIRFLIENKLVGFIALGEIILCATGGEAMYADMGLPRQKTYTSGMDRVFIALVLNYLGQGHSC